MADRSAENAENAEGLVMELDVCVLVE